MAFGHRFARCYNGLVDPLRGVLTNQYINRKERVMVGDPDVSQILATGRMQYVE